MWFDLEKILSFFRLKKWNSNQIDNYNGLPSSVLKFEGPNTSLELGHGWLKGCLYTTLWVHIALGSDADSN